MKAVLLEVSHWHFPLYIKDLLDGGIEVVGFSDKSEEIRAKYSKLFRCEGYNDWKETLGSCSYDIAFAFGEHAQMYTIATSLLANGRPFSLEKPNNECGKIESIITRFALKFLNQASTCN